MYQSASRSTGNCRFFQTKSAIIALNCVWCSPVGVQFFVVKYQNIGIMPTPCLGVTDKQPAFIKLGMWQKFRHHLGQVEAYLRIGTKVPQHMHAKRGSCTRKRITQDVKYLGCRVKALAAGDVALLQECRLRQAHLRHA